jgi:hypothetical protein
MAQHGRDYPFKDLVGPRLPLTTDGVEIAEVGRTENAIRVVTNNANTIRFIGKNGRVIEEAGGKSAEIQFKDNELYAYVRIECLGQRGDVSWTQPFFRD